MSVESGAGAGEWPGAQPHPLVVHHTEQRQFRLAEEWVVAALTRGDKVLYKHRFGTGRDTAPDRLTRTAAAAVGTGQLEFVDAERLHAETGGKHEALYERHVDLVRTALRSGYPTVVMTADGPASHTIAPDPDELLAHERDLGRLTAELDVRSLCRYDLRTERSEFLTQLLDVHHRAVSDDVWDAVLRDGRMVLNGEIDSSNAERVASVLRVGARGGVHTVDLAGVRFLAAAGIGALTSVAELIGERGGTLVVANASRGTARMLALVGFTEHPAVELVAPEQAP